MNRAGGKTNRANSFTEDLRALALSSGAVLFGVAARYPDEDDYDRFPRAVCVAAVLSRGVLDTVKDGPTKIYAYHYRAINAFLDHVAVKLVARIEGAGYRSLHVPASQIVDWERLTGEFSHRELARRAGLGFIGLNNLLVTRRFGAGVRLVSVLTDMPLREDVPVDYDCGACRKCVAVCPAGAIGESLQDFNLEKCVEKLRSFKKAVGHHICGVCVRACKGPKKDTFRNGAA